MSNIDWQSLSDKICVEMIEENKALKKENRELQSKVNELNVKIAGIQAVVAFVEDIRK